MDLVVPDDRPDADAERLEHLWAGDFGDAYSDRNRDAGREREPFWRDVLDRTGPDCILEVGANVGANLAWLRHLRPSARLTGLDVNAPAIVELSRRVAGVNGVVGTARALPFADGSFDLVATVAVLIHQSAEALPVALAESVRCTSRWLLCAELYTPTTTPVEWRGQSGALIKRDYGRLYQDAFPALDLVDHGVLDRSTGWDDVTFWLFEKH